jgi:uncharacterized protein
MMPAKGFVFDAGCENDTEAGAPRPLSHLRNGLALLRRGRRAAWLALRRPPTWRRAAEKTLTTLFLVHTLIAVKFAFDPAKDAINRSKHGLSLREAARLDWNRVLAKLDIRTDYGEPRQIGYGPIGRRLYCVVFVDRGDTLRIISLRKANNREIDRYEAQIASSDRG